MRNKKILITCGSTWVSIDDTRVISNISSGQLGQRLAQDFKKIGAKVTLLEGPVACSLKSSSIKVIKFRFFEELFNLLHKELKRPYDAVIHAAAVSDYQPKKTWTTKISSGLKTWRLELVPTKKIINHIKKIDPKTFLVGFKLESKIDKALAKNKANQLIQKAACDLVVVNSLANKKYTAYIVDKSLNILNHADSRQTLSRNLVKILNKKL